MDNRYDSVGIQKAQRLKRILCHVTLFFGHDEFSLLHF